MNEFFLLMIFMIEIKNSIYSQHLKHKAIETETLWVIN